MTNWSDETSRMITDPRQIKSEATKRLKTYVTESINPKLQSDWEEQGWHFDRQMKSSVRMARDKTHDRMFEDRIWALMAHLGFTALNYGRNFTIPYGQGLHDKHQIDVFAMDDETILVIECKSSASRGRSALKQDIEAWIGIRPGLISTLRQRYPEKKIGFILATNNIILGEAATDRLRQANIFHLDEVNLEYFTELVKHLGTAARYQFLGQVFAGAKIPGLDSRVPAIRGRMGGLRYYSFAIEPARLLKLGYVLHNTAPDGGHIGAYQRLIRKSRIAQIHRFIDEGGFFPNSIIINIDQGKRDLQFDLASSQLHEYQIGVLHLPNTYRSCYIIDGQHRLYGYSESDRARTELIPVVAFLNMTQSDQVQMFMDINENQKSVSRNLRNLLEQDLHRDSTDLSRAAKSVRLRIADELGNSSRSPLLGRVILGESSKTVLRCISVESLQTGLRQSGLLSNYTKSRVTQIGSLDQGSADESVRFVSRFLMEYFLLISELSPSQYELGSAPGGLLFTNLGVDSLVRIAGDFIEHIPDGEDVRGLPVARLIEECQPLVAALSNFVESLTIEQISQLRKEGLGAGGPGRLVRAFQVRIHEKIPSFAPAGLLEELEDRKRNLSTRSYELISEIEGFLKEDVRHRLEVFYSGETKLGIPRETFKRANELMAEKNYSAKREDEVDIWDCMNLIDYQKIMQKSSTQWQEVFQERYATQNSENTKLTEKAAWLSRVNEIRNKTMHHLPVTSADYEFLEDVVESIIRRE